MALFDRRIPLIAALIVLIAAAVGLSACGRKGGLEAPPSAALKADDQGADQEPVEKPKKPFFLDFLL